MHAIVFLALDNTLTCLTTKPSGIGRCSPNFLKRGNPNPLSWKFSQASCKRRIVVCNFSQANNQHQALPQRWMAAHLEKCWQFCFSCCSPPSFAVALIKTSLIYDRRLGLSAISRRSRCSTIELNQLVYASGADICIWAGAAQQSNCSEWRVFRFCPCSQVLQPD